MTQQVAELLKANQLGGTWTPSPELAVRLAKLEQMGTADAEDDYDSDDQQEEQLTPTSSAQQPQPTTATVTAAARPRKLSKGSHPINASPVPSTVSAVSEEGPELTESDADTTRQAQSVPTTPIAVKTDRDAAGNSKVGNSPLDVFASLLVAPDGAADDAARSRKRSRSGAAVQAAIANASTTN